LRWEYKHEKGKEEEKQGALDEFQRGNPFLRLVLFRPDTGSLCVEDARDCDE